MGDVIDFIAEKKRIEEEKMWREHAEAIQAPCLLMIFEWTLEALDGYTDTLDDE